MKKILLMGMSILISNAAYAQTNRPTYTTINAAQIIQALATNNEITLTEFQTIAPDIKDEAAGDLFNIISNGNPTITLEDLLHTMIIVANFNATLNTLNPVDLSLVPVRPTLESLETVAPHFSEKSEGGGTKG